MQKLKFEETWDRALSEKDRLGLMQLFKEVQNQECMYTVYRYDFNYKGELLVIALIHNRAQSNLTFNKEEITFNCGNYTATQSFTVPRLQIAGNTSTAWTFIFKNPGGLWDKKLVLTLK